MLISINISVTIPIGVTIVVTSSIASVVTTSTAIVLAVVKISLFAMMNVCACGIQGKLVLSIVNWISRESLGAQDFGL